MSTELKASDLLKSDHPLHQAFTNWVRAKNGSATKRQARKFLQEFPKYRERSAA
jgi:hypothetical protein